VAFHEGFDMVDRFVCHFVGHSYVPWIG
jgi:hypothetical protein